MLDEAKRKYSVAMTKCDLVYPEDLARRCYLVQKELQKRKYSIEKKVRTLSITSLI